MARLIVKSDGAERTVELDPGEITSIGRDPGNTIPLDDARGASRRHCQVTPVRRDGHPSFELIDLGATNKTRVNGAPTDRKLLTTGDVIQVGSTEFVFEDEDEANRLRDAGRHGVCYLEWVTGGSRGEKVMLDLPRVSLGRRESNTVRLTDRMSSGHHCEITKDLNGYTIRDLGSTNGTLVNGEPTSEAPLSHGSRIRIGNSRFVFKDPSMKDIEVELSQFEEDEGWGMMGDIDLSKARGSYAGLLVGLVILAGAGVGGWYISQQAEQRAGDGLGQAVSSEIDNGSMEAGDYLPWTLDAANDEVQIQIAKGGKPGTTLQVSHRGDAGTVTAYYEDEFEALADKPFQFEAWFKAGGDGDAALVATWRTDDQSVSRTVTLASGGGGWTHVRRTLVKPTWAGGLRLGVRVAPGATARLDTVRLTRGGEGELTELDCPGHPRASVAPDGTLDLVDSVGRPLALGLAPVAEQGGALLRVFLAEEVTGGGAQITARGTFVDAAEPVPATVTWSRTDEGIAAEIACPGADQVGLAGRLVRARVGDLVNVLTPSGARALAASGGQSVEKVQKTLAGNPDADTGGRMSLVTFVVQPEAKLVMEDGPDAALLELTHWVAGATGTVALVTDYTIQRAQAQAALQAARAELREQPGQGIERLREVAVEFPFEQTIVSEALQAASNRETRANQDIAALTKALDGFRIYRSDASLRQVDDLSARLRGEFPPREGGRLEARVSTLVAAVDRERAAYYQEVRGPELTRLENLAALLQDAEGYEPMAVLYLRAIVQRFQGLESEDTPLGRRVKKAQQTLEGLISRIAGLAETVPPAPPRKN